MKLPFCDIFHHLSIKNKQKIVDYRKICVILQTKTNEVIRCEKLHFYNNVFLYNIEYNSINLITRERFLWKKDSWCFSPDCFSV